MRAWTCKNSFSNSQKHLLSLDPTVRKYCTANHIRLDTKHDALCVDVTDDASSPLCDTSSVLDAFDRVRDFYDFMDERYTKHHFDLTCFVEQSLRSSIAAIPELNALFTDNVSVVWMKGPKYSISYDPSHGVVKAEYRLPLIVRSLFADDLDAFYKRRIDIQHGNLEKHRLSMQNDIGKAHFECLVSIVQAKAVSLRRPPIKAK